MTGGRSKGIMTYLSLLPAFVLFWFYDVPKSLIVFFASLNSAFLQLVSLPLFLRTFFKPVKNEYRKGLVGFSIVMGMIIKSVLIAADLLLFLILLFIELIILVIFIAWPIGTVALLFLNL